MVGERPLFRFKINMDPISGQGFIVAILIIAVARFLIYVVLALTTILMVWQKQKLSIFIYGFCVGISSIIIARVLSLFYYNSRPFAVGNFRPMISHLPDNGFPSDHTLLAASCAVVIYRINKRWGVFFFLIAAAIGFARVFAGVHHAIDIIASLIIAPLVGYCVYVIIKHWPMRSNTALT